MQTRIAMERKAWLLAVAVISVACSEDDPAANAAADAAADHPTADVISGDGSDAAAETFSVPLCAELGVDNVLPFDTNITNAFALKVTNDCRVIQLLLPLSPEQGNLWFEATSAWTGAFFACPGTDGSVTTFGPVETGLDPSLTQSDIDVLVEHFAAATEETLTLSSAQSTALRSELAAVAAQAVNLPIPGHALSLCTDGGTDGGGGAAGAAGAGGAAGAAGTGGAAGASDAGVDATFDASSDASDAGADS